MKSRAAVGTATRSRWSRTGARHRSRAPAASSVRLPTLICDTRRSSDLPVIVDHHLRSAHMSSCCAHMSMSWLLWREGAMGPDELFLRAVIARRYYLEGRTRVEIAEEFGLSRFKVARMLEEALEIRHGGDHDPRPGRRSTSELSTDAAAQILAAARIRRRRGIEEHQRSSRSRREGDGRATPVDPARRTMSSASTAAAP